MYRCTQMIPMRWSMKGELGKNWVLVRDCGWWRIWGYLWTRAKSKKELRQQIEDKSFGMPCWQRIPVRLEISSMSQAGPCTIGSGILILETQQSVIPPTGVYDFWSQGCSRKLAGAILKNQLMSWTSVSQQIAIRYSYDRWSSNDHLGCQWFLHRLRNWLEKLILKRPLITACWASWRRRKIDGRWKSYPIQKGSHFILPNDVESWALEGQGLEVIVSHP